MWLKSLDQANKSAQILLRLHQKKQFKKHQNEKII